MRSMKAHELINSADVWCREAPAKDRMGNKVQALDSRAEKWCALGAVEKVYPREQWESVMNGLLRALSVSEEGLAKMTAADKACCLIEWNDEPESSFLEIRETLLSADV